MKTTGRRLVRQDLRQCIERACESVGRAIAAWHKAAPSRHNKLRALREARGWTQVELARRSGVAQSTISSIESGVRGANMGAALSLRLARALGVRIQDVVSGVP